MKNDAFTIAPERVIQYDAHALSSFAVYGFEWIDNFHFLRNPEDFLGERSFEFVSIAEARFKELGWAGDGEVSLLWLPPFVFPLELNVAPEGIVVWHVKQVEDGVSFLLSPIKLPFPEFEGASQ